MSGTRWFGALLLGGALVTAGCGEPARGGPAEPVSPRTGQVTEWRTAGCGTSRSAEVVSVGGATMPVTPPDLDAVMRRIESVGRSEHGSSYAGLEVDQAAVRAIVYRVPSAGFDAFVRAAAGAQCVVVRDAAHCARDLDALRERITADLAYWAARGVRINSVAARHDGTGVEVGVEDVARARAELPGRYGTAPLVVVEQAPLRPLPWTGPAPAPRR